MITCNQGLQRDSYPKRFVESVPLGRDDKAVITCYQGLQMEIDQRIYLAHEKLERAIAKQGLLDPDWQAVRRACKLLQAVISDQCGLTSEEVKAWLSSPERCSATDLAAKLGVSRQTLYKHIRKIKASKPVEK